MRFLTDWAEASRHPWKTAITCSVLVWIGLGIAAYLTVASQDIAGSLVLSGIISLAFLIIIVVRLGADKAGHVRPPDLATKRWSYVLDASLVIIGTSFFIGGLISEDWILSVVGLILGVLGAGMFVSRRRA
jgi:hypothetical protein